MPGKPRVYRPCVPDDTVVPRSFFVEYPWRAEIDGVSWPCESWVEAVEKTALYLERVKSEATLSGDSVRPFV